MANKKRGGVDIQLGDLKIAVHPEYELIERIENTIKIGDKARSSIYDIYFSLLDGYPPISLIGDVLCVCLEYAGSDLTSKEIKQKIFECQRDQEKAWPKLLASYSELASSLLHGGAQPYLQGGENSKTTEEEIEKK